MDWNTTCSQACPERADSRARLITVPRAINYSLGSLLSLFGCLLVGLAIGTMGAFVQAHRVVFPVGSLVVAIPWGALLVLLTLVLVTRVACWVVGSRLAGFLLFGGWAVSTLGFALESGSGDLAISGGARQWGYVIGGALLGAAAVWLPLPSTGHVDRGMRGDRLP